MQYNAALAITGARRGSSKEKLYQELGLESLKQWRWFRKLLKINPPSISLIKSPQLGKHTEQ